MIDIVTGVVIGGLAVLNSAAHVAETNKLNKLEKVVIGQKKEILALEASTALTGVLSVADSIMWKKEFQGLQKSIDENNKKLNEEMSKLSKRIDDLSVAIATKPPIITLQQESPVNKTE